MRALVANPRLWGLLGLLGLAVGLAGPFNTFEYLSILPRLAYWVAIVLLTAFMGTFITSLIEAWLKPLMPFWLAVALACLVAGPSIAALVALINIGTFGPDVRVIDLLPLTLYCTLITGAVAVMGATWPHSSQGQEQPAHMPERQAAPLLARLPLPQRGRLLHIAVSDHYVHVTTEKGTSLVLMRLSDAMGETAPVPGIQLHRSHWVALDAVKRSTRQNGKPVVELENGTIVPVSRTYMAAAREAGLFS